MERPKLSIQADFELLDVAVKAQVLRKHSHGPAIKIPKDRNKKISEREEMWYFAFSKS